MEEIMFNAVLEKLIETEWVCGTEDNSFNVLGLAKTFYTDTPYVVFRYVIWDGVLWYFHRASIVNDNISLNDPLVIRTSGLADAIIEFNSIAKDSPRMMKIDPIKYITVHNEIFPREFTEDGYIIRHLFDGSVDDMKFMLEVMNWMIPVGNTSNCSKFYDISGIAITETEEVLPIIVQKNTLGWDYIVTPCRVYRDGTAEGNYGTPTGGTTVERAIYRFNKDIYRSQQYGCKLMQITDVYMSDGTTYNNLTYSE